ncbi:hypothetical protein RJ639_020958 [Escallonia herrerae]|uniref:Transcription initiation factor TFIID subunit 8 n=1 Tax=Escallonia herrerae TaxID=1293975 RepID=A0AA88S5T5_9ASTE|nr:hypothetical protein RJ639_026516 [Escallonia herrerae]KAK3000558.1 hypothetical protein RJ639_020958 [Escallonia herrerae]
MSDGGKVGESKREKRACADEFGRAVSKIAVGQICKNVGFEGLNESALEAFADIAVRYLRDLGKTSNFYANLAGRTESNVFDIIQGLEDLGGSMGLPGTSAVGDCVTGSGTVKGIVEYVESAEETPFAQPLPHFPVVRHRRMTPSFTQMGETPVFKSIPAWLPAFPDKHTYVHSPVWNERVENPLADKIELARQRRKAESSLLSLQQRLVRSGATEASTSADIAGGGNGLVLAQSKNPFLAAPVQAGGKDVSPPVLPTKLSDGALVENHVSLVEAFAPAIDAVKDGYYDSGTNAGKSLPDKRPAVQLNFKSGRKSIGESLDLSIRNRNSGKTTTWFGRDDERDDKKRRAELILRHSMDNPTELTQL